MASQPPLVRWLLVEGLTYILLGGQGYVGLHAAGVVHRGRALILRGPGGAGKTTLAYAWARAGGVVLAEEVVWFRPQAQPELVWGVPWTLRLVPEAIRLFPELTGLPLVRQANGETKIEVDLESLWPGVAQPMAAPGPLFLVERHGGPQTEIASVDADSGLEAFWQGAAGDEQTNSAIQTVYQQLSSRGLYHLCLGTDLAAALRALQTAVDRQ